MIRLRGLVEQTGDFDLGLAEDDHAPVFPATPALRETSRPERRRDDDVPHLDRLDGDPRGVQRSSISFYGGPLRSAPGREAAR